MQKIFEKLFKSKTSERSLREKVERVKFTEEVRKQFLQLKEKGLSISVFTL